VNRPTRKTRPVHRPGKMNATEAKYAALLDQLIVAGEIVRYEFERIKFVLADRTTYTPDFYVVCRDHIELHEVKGFLRDDANVKFKACADRFPEFIWKMIRWKNKTIGWEVMREA